MRGSPTPSTGGSTTWAGVKAALADAAGDVATLAGSLVQRLTGLNASAVAGVTLENATAPDAGQPAQWAPLLLWKGGARVIGSNRVVQVRITLEPTTAGNLTFRVQYDLGAGGGWLDAFYFTTSSPGQFVPGLATTRFLALGSNGSFILDLNNSGLVLGGSTETILNGRAAAQPLWIRGFATAANIDPIRLHAAGETKDEDEILVGVGDGTTYAQRLAFTTGGQFLGTIWRVTDVKTAANTSGNYTAVAGQMVLCDASAAGFVVTLPTAVGVKGRMVGVCLVTSSANAVTMNTTSAQTISLAASGTTTVQDAGGLVAAIFVSDGANWWRLKLT